MDVDFDNKLINGKVTHKMKVLEKTDKDDWANDSGGIDLDSLKWHSDTSFSVADPNAGIWDAAVSAEKSEN
jgi:hypothetical protein